MFNMWRHLWWLSVIINEFLDKKRSSLGEITSKSRPIVLARFYSRGKISGATLYVSLLDYIGTGLCSASYIRQQHSTTRIHPSHAVLLWNNQSISPASGFAAVGPWWDTQTDALSVLHKCADNALYLYIHQSTSRNRNTISQDKYKLKV